MRKELEDARAFIATLPEELRNALQAHDMNDVCAAAIESAAGAPLNAPKGVVFAMGFIAGAVWGRQTCDQNHHPSFSAPS